MFVYIFKRMNMEKRKKKKKKKKKKNSTNIDLFTTSAHCICSMKEHSYICLFMQTCITLGRHRTLAYHLWSQCPCLHLSCMNNKSDCGIIPVCCRHLGRHLSNPCLYKTVCPSYAIQLSSEGFECLITAGECACSKNRGSKAPREIF